MKLFVVALLCAISYAQTELDVSQVQADIKDLANPLLLGGFPVCDYHVDESATLLGKTVSVDGSESDSLDKSVEETVIQGFVCDSKTSVVLLFDERGLSGRIGVNVLIIPQSKELSIIDEAPEASEFPRDLKKKPWLQTAEQRFNDYMAELLKGRRRLAEPLAYGSVDINIHLEIDAYMVDNFKNQGEHTEFKALKYAVDLIAVINEDVFKPAGYNLRVTSMNERSDYLCLDDNGEKMPCEWPLELIYNEPIPDGAHIYFLMTSWGLGGGVAWLGGLWDGNGYGMCGGINGNFDFWDRKCTAHEIGHILGAVHTHELGLDTCDVCLDNEDPVTNAPQQSTIMSYCQHCEDGYFNIEHEFVKDNVVRMQAAYEDNKGVLTPHTSCGSMKSDGLPTTGLAFWLKTDDYACVNVGGSAECLTWQYDSDRQVVFKTGGMYDECWKVKDDCSGIVLDRCPTYELGGYLCTSKTCTVPDEFKFEARSEGFYSAKCDMDRYAGGVARARDGNFGFMGRDVGEAVVDWCVGEIDAVGASYECPDALQPIECGQTVTSKTNVYCMEHTYELILPSNAVSVHLDTCGSQIDTELSVRDIDTAFQLHSARDRSESANTPTCVMDAQSNTLQDNLAALYGLELDTSKTYDVQVKGWCTTVGGYTLKVICEDEDGNNMGPTAFPTQAADLTTFHPSKAPTNNAWFELSGDCDVQLPNCVSSKNFPSKYGSRESCTVTMLQDALPEMVAFKIWSSDNLVIADKLVQDLEQLPDRINAGERITWKSRYGRDGWQLCFSEAPTTTTTTAPPGPDFSLYCQYNKFKSYSMCGYYTSTWGNALNIVRNVKTLSKCGELAGDAGMEYFTYDSSRLNCWIPKEDAYTTCVTNAESNSDMTIYKTTCSDVEPPTTTTTTEAPSESSGCTHQRFKRDKVCDPYGADGLSYDRGITIEKCAKKAETSGKQYFSYHDGISLCYMPTGDAYKACVQNIMYNDGIDTYELVCPTIQSSWTLQSSLQSFIPYWKLLAVVGAASLIAYACKRGKTYVPITGHDEI